MATQLPTAAPPKKKSTRTAHKTEPSPPPNTANCENSRRGRLTFYNITINRGPEVFFGPLIEVLPVDNAHLLEESGLAALARSEQQDLHEPLDVRLVAVDTLVYLLRFPQLLHLAAREETVGKTYR